MGLLFGLAWRDLRGSGRSLWIFFACLVLGVSLVAAGGGLYRQVADALRADARLLFGGDVEVEAREPLPENALQWMRDGAQVSRMLELRTMMRADDGAARLVELQSADDAYPLYGEVELDPSQPLQQALGERGGTWGVALDSTLAQRMGIGVGDQVSIGDARLAVTAIVTRQPDRSLRADWSGAPVLVAEAGLLATGLVQPLSRIEYRYRVRTERDPTAWRDDFIAAFPDLDAEVETFAERSDRIAEVLGQIGSGLLLIGFSALFIGGLGVFNSVQSHLQGKLASIATLRALGMRGHRVAAVLLLQILILATLASAVGVLVGNSLALVGALAAAQRLPIALLLAGLWQPSLVALGFGVLTALAFALPALGRALSVSPAVLFRGLDGQLPRTPRTTRWLTAAVGATVVILLVLVLPDPRFGLLFAAATALVLALLDGVTWALRRSAGWLQTRRGASVPLALQLALANLQRPSSPLRPALLSLGSALTLLVACTLLVTTLLRTVNETVPASAPALVFHDVQTPQIPLLHSTLQASVGLRELRIAPLVLGRLVGVEGADLRTSDDSRRVRESRDEHKLSDRSGNFDDVIIERGAWWPQSYVGPPLVAMEDREADQLGLKIGDRLRFEILGQPLEAQLVAIYGQRRMQARLWLEAIFSDGALDPFITRHVGAAYLPPEQAIAAQDRLAAVAPNIATMRTESVLRETRTLMARATAGLSVVAMVCLAASLLVLGSVIAASRSRQVYEATVMHAIGARRSVLGQVLLWEYLLLAAVTSGFAALAGSVLATALLHWRLALDPAGLYWSGVVTALFVSLLSLGLGAAYLLRQMRLEPSTLLRSGA